MKVRNNYPKQKWLKYRINGIVLSKRIYGYETIEIEDESEIIYNGSDAIKLQILNKTGKKHNRKIQQGTVSFNQLNKYSISNLGTSDVLKNIDGNYFICGVKNISMTSDINSGEWFQVYSTPDKVYDICKLSNSEYLACGGRGFDHVLMVKSSDSGNTWTTIELPNVANKALYSISSYNNNVWCGGAGLLMLHSTDYGETWSAQTVPGSATLYITSVFFINESKGWACGNNSTIYYTQNSGETWTKQTFQSTTYQNIFFSNQNDGKVVGGYVHPTLGRSNLSYSNNGGSTWINGNKSPNYNVVFYNLHFINENEGWACGGNNAIFHTLDGGINWSAQTSLTNYINTLTNINFTDNLHGIAMGNNSLKTTIDGGITWNTLLDPKDSNSKIIQLKDGKLLSLSLSSYKISNNYGNTFSEITDSPPWSGGGRISTMPIVYKLNETTSFWIGLDVLSSDSSPVTSTTSVSKVFKTSDGGNSWHQISVTNFGFPFSIFFVNDTIGFIGGQYGRIFKTTDGGDSWALTPSTAVTNKAIFSLYFKDENNGFGLGLYGQTVHTDNGGNSWTASTPLNTEYTYMSNYISISESTGYVTASCIPKNYVDFYLVTDFGRSFSKLNSLTEVSAVDSKLVYVNPNTFILYGDFICYTQNNFKTLNVPYKNFPQSYTTTAVLPNNIIRLFESSLKSYIDLDFNEIYI